VEEYELFQHKEMLGPSNRVRQMFLVPFIHRILESIYTSHIVHVFLQHGTLFLQLEPSEVDSFCSENGLFYKRKVINENYCYLEIDTEATNLKDFYSYYENSEAECWRKFVLVGNLEEDFLHVNDSNPEFILPVLKSILELSKE
jgi:hypothetical protein